MGTRELRLVGRRVFVLVLLAETLHAAGRVDELALARKERMRRRRDFHFDHEVLDPVDVAGLVALHARTGDEFGAHAGVDKDHRVVLGMSFFLHSGLSLIHISEPTRLLSISYAVF